MGKIEKIYEDLKTNNENLPQEVHFFFNWLLMRYYVATAQKYNNQCLN